MNTTHLHLELLRAGVGTTVWVALTILSVFGSQWISPERLFSAQAFVPLLALISLLGILTDRAADWIRRCRAFNDLPLATSTNLFVGTGSQASAEVHGLDMGNGPLPGAFRDPHRDLEN